MVLYVVFTFLLAVTPVPDNGHNDTNKSDSTSVMPSKEYSYKFYHGNG